MSTVEMSLLFTTRFNESCFQAIPAIAQWMDDISSELTIAHVYNPRHTSLYDAEQQLISFFAEADRYPHTRRVLIEATDVASALAAYLEERPADMVFCPASDRVGLPRPWHLSRRARLLQRTSAALWTMGAAMDQRRFGAPKRVACLLSRRSDSVRPLQVACQYALRTGATLQLICVVPQVDEGTLRNAVSFDEPLAASVADAELRRVAAALPVSPELHIVSGRETSAMLRTLARARTDLLFVGKWEATRGWVGAQGIARFVDRATCPVVCVDHDYALPMWNLRLPERTAIDVHKRESTSGVVVELVQKRSA